MEMDKTKIEDLVTIRISDIVNYLKTLDISKEDMVGCSKHFIKLNDMNLNEFQLLSQEEKDWFAQMYNCISEYKHETIHNKIYDTIKDFELDIRKYTNNKKCIEHFSNGFKQIWMSDTDEEKKEIVKRFEGQFPNDNAVKDNTFDKVKTSVQLKIEDILDNRKNNLNTLKQFEDDIPTYDDNETVIDYAKKENKDVVVSNAFDIDSLFVDK